jgi:hypothetical protein
MTRDDIIRMAQEAGKTQSGVEYTMPFEVLERFAKLIAAAEREACAEAAETVTPRHIECGRKIAFAIRERGAL